MGPALLLAGAGMQGGGQLFSAFSGSQESKAQAAMEKWGAALNLQEAGQIRKATKFQRIRESEAGARSMGTLRANLGMSGGRMDVGSALMVVGEAAKEIELNDLLLAYEGEVSAKRKESEAAMGFYQAKLYKRRAKNQMIGGFIGAGGTALQGFGQYKRGY